MYSFGSVDSCGRIVKWTYAVCRRFSANKMVRVKLENPIKWKNSCRIYITFTFGGQNVVIILLLLLLFVSICYKASLRLGI